MNDKVIGRLHSSEIQVTRLLDGDGVVRYIGNGIENGLETEFSTNAHCERAINWLASAVFYGDSFFGKDRKQLPILDIVPSYEELRLRFYDPALPPMSQEAWQAVHPEMRMEICETLVEWNAAVEKEMPPDSRGVKGWASW